MGETRLSELKEQDAANALIGGLMERMELVTWQMKEMQAQSELKWEMMRNQMVSLTKTVQEGRKGETGSESSRTGNQWNRNEGAENEYSKGLSGFVMPKLEFPEFDGNNLDDWLCKCQRFFELEGVPEDKKVKVASLYMYGAALQWHYTFVRNRGAAEPLAWGEYVNAITRRFGREVFEDPMGRMKNLKQEGAYSNLYAYMEEFDACLRRVLEKINLPVDFQVSLFINGLKEEYRGTMWLLRPSDLLSAQASARLLTTDCPPAGGDTSSSRLRIWSRGQGYNQGTTDNVTRGSEAPLMRSPVVGSGGYRPSDNRGVSALVARRRLSQEEIADRRQRGLCFGCNEPFTRDHRCSERQLFSLTVDSVNEEEEIPCNVTNGSEEVQVTLHALNGKEGAMQIDGRYKGKVLHILIGSGSTHNFVDAGVVKGLGIQTAMISPVKITVADGRSLLSCKTLNSFSWEMQGHQFEADFYIIPLAGCEMVLGVKWLAPLGDITWNFQSGLMSFQRAEKRVTLRGEGIDTCWIRKEGNTGRRSDGERKGGVGGAAAR